MLRLLRRTCLFAVPAAVSLVGSRALADTTVPGGAVSNQTWTAAEGPYLVQGDITIPDGAFLHIQAGTVVHFASTDGQKSGADTARVEIIVQGALTIEGTKTQPVVLEAQTGNAKSIWHGITVPSGANASVSLTYVNLSNAAAGLDVSTSASISVSQSSFEESDFGVKLDKTDATLTGILVTNDNHGISVQDGNFTLDQVTATTNSTGLECNGTGKTTVTNSLFTDNTVYAVYAAQTSSIDDSTLDSNTSHAIYTDLGATVEIRNDILTNNGDGVYVHAGAASSVTTTYSDLFMNGADFFGTTAGAGCISADPMFKGAPTDLSLLPGSPCIDAGNAVSPSDHDLAGTMRPQDGDPTLGAAYDMGAFEYLPRCGDGVQQSPEECDDGNQTDSDACRNSCKLPSCGDGVQQSGEECDDGNTTDGDGCSSECKKETGDSSSSTSGTGSGDTSSSTGSSGDGGSGGKADDGGCTVSAVTGDFSGALGALGLCAAGLVVRRRRQKSMR